MPIVPVVCVATSKLPSLAGELTKPWESDLALCHKFVQRYTGHSPDKELLIKQWVIRSQRAGKVIVIVVVVAKSRVSLGWDKLVDVDFIAHAHHQNDA